MSERYLYSLGEQLITEDTATGAVEYVPVYSQQLSTNTTNSTEKHITLRSQDLSSLICLSKSYLHFQFNIRDTTANAVYSAGENATLTSNVLAFIRRRILRLGDMKIEDRDFNFIQANLDSYIFWGRDFVESQGSNLFYFPDYEDALSSTFLANSDGGILVKRGAGNALDANGAITAVGNAAVATYWNNSFTGTGRRRKLTYNSRQVHCIIPLSILFNFVRYYPKICSGLPVECEIELASDAIIGVHGNGVNPPQLNLQGAGVKLMLCRVTAASAAPKITNLMRSGHEEKIVWEDAQTYMKPYSDLAGATSMVIQAPAEKIKRVIVCFQHVDRLTSPEDINDISLYDHCNLQRIGIDINGHRIPSRDWTVNFTEGGAGALNGILTSPDWVQPYLAYQEATKSYEWPLGENYRGGGMLDYYSFGERPMFIFDTSYLMNQIGLSSGASTVTVNWTLGAAPGFDYNAFVTIYFEQETKLKFEKDGTTSFTR